MRPEIKSSIATALLLFLFGLTTTAGIILPPDTIILDDEYIYIEKQEKEINLDSLQEEEQNDIQQDNPYKVRVMISASVGLQGTLAGFSTAVTDQQPVDVFMGRNNSFQLNPLFGADIGLNIYERPVTSGEKKLSLHVGIDYNQVQFKSSSINPELLQKDSIFSLYVEDENLLLHYFNIFDTMPGGVIIGEPDTLNISLKKELTRLRTLDIPLRLRWTQSIGTTPVSWFVEAGVLWRHVVDVIEATDNFLVNERAEFSQLNSTDFRATGYIQPMFSGGMKYYLGPRDKEGASISDRLSVGCSIHALLPARAISGSDLYYFNTTNYTLRVMATWHI